MFHSLDVFLYLNIFAFKLLYSIIKCDGKFRFLPPKFEIESANEVKWVSFFFLLGSIVAWDMLKIEADDKNDIVSKTYIDSCDDNSSFWYFVFFFLSLCVSVYVWINNRIMVPWIRWLICWAAHFKRDRERERELQIIFRTFLLNNR